MIDVKNLQIELKIGAILGITALVLSILAGVIAGIEVGVVIIRAFVALILFTGLGYGAVTVLKKLVPEIGEIQGEEIKVAESEIQLDEIDADAEADAEPAPEPAGEQFSELNTDEIPRVQPDGGGIEPAPDVLGGTETGNAVNPSAGKLGKHIIANEDLFKYEPKLMAEAVRTMMSKDEE